MRNAVTNNGGGTDQSRGGAARRLALFGVTRYFFVSFIKIPRLIRLYGFLQPRQEKREGTVEAGNGATMGSRRQAGEAIKPGA
jgi:hypothetical protein